MQLEIWDQKLNKILAFELNEWLEMLNNPLSYVGSPGASTSPRSRFSFDHTFPTDSAKVDGGFDDSDEEELVRNLSATLSIAFFYESCILFSC